MKFQAPREVTALSCAGEEIIPDAQGCFEAAETSSKDLRTHGCVAAPQTEPSAEPPRAKKRARFEKAD